MENNMSIKDAMIAFWTKAFVFKGRARRKEVWLNILGNLLIAIALGVGMMILDTITSGKLHLSEHYYFFLNKLFPYFTTIPAMAQASRRMQDINMDGKIAIVLTLMVTFLGFIFDRIMPIFNIKFINHAPLLIVFGIIIALPSLFLFIINFIKGNDGPNKYGEDPKRVL